MPGRMQISIDDLLAARLSEYVSQGYAVRDALVKALADVAQQLGVPSIEMGEAQFEGLAQVIEARLQQWHAAKDQGQVMVGPGVNAEIVGQDEYLAHKNKMG